MKYAIIQIGPYQYRVEEGKEYIVPKFIAEEGKKLEVSEVLAFADGEKVDFGKPFLKGAKVTLDIMEQGKGEKVTKMIFKAKSRYAKKVGHRKLTTKFKVNSIVNK